MPREITDLFSGDAFSAVTLTATVNDVPYLPQTLGASGLYTVSGSRTTDIAVSSKGGHIDIIKTSARGAPPAQTTGEQRQVKKATVTHLAIEAEVTADEVQNALNEAAALGVPELATAEAVIQEKLDGPMGLRASIELTHEYHRIGGIQGIVLDKDGSELFNWFDFFGITPAADHTTNFGALTADGGAFEVECTNLIRDMITELEGFPVMSVTPVALCGDDYFDQVYSNKEVKAARKNRDTGKPSDVFGETKAFKTFEFGGITWVNYRGTKDGKVGIDTNEARLYTHGLPGLFQMIFGPPDIMGLTNTQGLPVHAFMPTERQTSRMAVVEAQSNPLTLCLRPRHLRTLKKA